MIDGLSLRLKTLVRSTFAVLSSLTIIACAMSPHHPNFSGESCQASTVRDVLLKDHDGSVLHADVSSVAQNGDDLALVGTPAYIWPKSSEYPPKAILGFFVSRSDRFRSIPLPQPDVRHPRIVEAARANAWHVIYARASGSTLQRPGSSEEKNVELWYAVLEHGEWRARTLIGTIGGAQLSQRQASKLLRHDNKLYFAFPVHLLQESPSTGTRFAIVMFSAKVGDSWLYDARLDTLKTIFPPSSVSLTVNPRGMGVTVSASMEAFDAGRLVPASIHRFRFTRTWEGLGRITVDLERHAQAVSVIKQGDLEAMAGVLVKSTDEIGDVFIRRGGRDSVPSRFVTVGKGSVFDQVHPFFFDSVQLGWVRLEEGQVRLGHLDGEIGRTISSPVLHPYSPNLAVKRVGKSDLIIAVVDTFRAAEGQPVISRYVRLRIGCRRSPTNLVN